MVKLIISISSTLVGLVGLKIIGQKLAIKRAAKAISTIIDSMKDEEPSEGVKAFYDTTKMSLDMTEAQLSKGSRKYYVEPRAKLAKMKAKLVASGYDVM